jgi:hypothetical protein
MRNFLMIVAALVLATGCASTAANQPSEMDKMKAELAELRLQHQRLQAQQAVTRHRGHRHARIRPVAAVPPARRRPVGPPQNWGWIHTPPDGCEKGPLSVEFRNYTNLYLRIFIDGREIGVRGADGILEHLPPGETLYACLDRVGSHNIHGVAYMMRYGNPQEVDRFRRNTHFGINMAYKRQRLNIDAKFLRFH